MNNAELKTVFDLAYDKLSKISIDDNFSREIADRRNRSFDKNRPDSFFYEHLVRDIHNAGMKAAIVTSKMPYIKEAFSNFDVNKVAQYTQKDLDCLLNNPKIIHNRRKLRDCIANAERIKQIAEEFGSFGEFLDQYKEKPTLLKEKLMSFGSVGPAVVLDYLKDVGMDFIKPDVHVLRVFSRLGLIDSEASFYEAVGAAETLKQATSEKLSVIDAVFWMYGGGGDGHLIKGICNKNKPLCHECPLTTFCRYVKV